MERFMKIVLALLVISVCAQAQEFRATLTGRITDTAGAAVADAKITIKNSATGEVTQATSGADGNYEAGFLLPGDYVVTVQKPGFETGVRQGVRLAIAQRATLDISLTVGQVSQ